MFQNKHFTIVWKKNLNTDLHNASPRDIWRKYTIFNYSIYLFWYFRDRGRQRKLIKELINTLTKESIEKKVHNLEHASSKLWAQLGTLQFQVVGTTWNTPVPSCARSTNQSEYMGQIFIKRDSSAGSVASKHNLLISTRLMV